MCKLKHIYKSDRSYFCRPFCLVSTFTNVFGTNFAEIVQFRPSFYPFNHEHNLHQSHHLSCHQLHIFCWQRNCLDFIPPVGKALIRLRDCVFVKLYLQYQALQWPFLKKRLIQISFKKTHVLRTYRTTQQLGISMSFEKNQAWNSILQTFHFKKGD